MDTNRKGVTTKQAAGAVAIAAGVGVGFWGSLILVDIGMFWYFFRSSTNVLQDYGLTEYAAKLVGVGFAGLVVFFADQTMRNLIRRRHEKWVPVLTGLMAIWFGIMYVVASPYESSPFNVFSGEAGKFYRDQYDLIHPLPSSHKVGPQGERVETFTKETAQEYQDQQGGDSRKSSSVMEPLLQRIRMDVEGLSLTHGSTVVHLAVRSRNATKEGLFFQPTSLYLTDEHGRAYELLRDNVEYFHSQYGWIYKRIREDEVYRFTVEYVAIPDDIRQLRMRDDRFGVRQLDHLLRNAQERRAQVSARERLAAQEQASREEGQRRVRERESAEANARVAEGDALRLRNGTLGRGTVDDGRSPSNALGGPRDDPPPVRTISQVFDARTGAIHYLKGADTPQQTRVFSNEYLTSAPVGTWSAPVRVPSTPARFTFSGNVFVMKDNDGVELLAGNGNDGTLDLGANVGILKFKSRESKAVHVFLTVQ